MSRQSPNQYADTDATWNTNVVLPEEVIEAYMDMQARVFAKHEGHPSFNHAMYSQTPQDFQEAYSAGYEQADRCQEVFGTMSVNNRNRTGIRNTTGIRYATGVAAKAFQAGFNARTME